VNSGRVVVERKQLTHIIIDYHSNHISDCGIHIASYGKGIVCGNNVAILVGNHIDIV
jgi:hypothetical protein